MMWLVVIASILSGVKRSGMQSQDAKQSPGG